MTVILIIVFYLFIPCLLVILAILRLYNKNKSVDQSLSSSSNQKEESLIEIKTLPNLFRENPQKAILHLGRINEAINNSDTSTIQLRFFLSVFRSVNASISIGDKNSLQIKSISESIANLLDQSIEAIQTNNKKSYYVSLSNLIGLSLLHEDYKPWLPSNQDIKRSSYDKALLKQLEIISELILTPQKEFEFQQHLRSWRKRDRWRNATGYQLLAFYYLGLRMNNSRLSEALPLLDEYPALIRDRTNVSDLVRKVHQALLNLEYDTLLMLLENDFKMMVKRT
jgi:hypothetical protein